MARRFEDVVDVLDYNELMRLKRDIDSGAISVKKLLVDKIRQKQKEHEKICATCSSNLELCSTNNYTLVFGPNDFKKKASFCGLDCLEYFVSRLRQMKSKPKEDNVTDSYI